MEALAIALAPHFTVIAPDLPGIGNSSIPASGLDMQTSAKRVRDAVSSLGYTNVRVVGHDIGLMVAYAYAAMYRQEVKRLALMDAFLPGVAGWEPIYNDPAFGTFASMARRRWRSSQAASAYTSTISGTTSRTMVAIRFQIATAAHMLPHILGPEE